MGSPRSRRKKTRQYATPAASRWSSLIADWSRSGETQRAYCQRMGISHGTFAWWRHQFARSASAPTDVRQASSASPRFVRVEMLPAGGPKPDPERDVAATETGRAFSPVGIVPLEIILRGEIHVRVGRDCDPAFLGRVLAVLREAAC
jgi:hypothetical protein